MIRQSGKQLGVAQLGSALEWGSRGRKFKSSHPDHAGTQLKAVFFACRVRRRYFCVTLARAYKAVVTQLLPHPSALPRRCECPCPRIYFCFRLLSLFRRLAPYKSSHPDRVVADFARPRRFFITAHSHRALLLFRAKSRFSSFVRICRDHSVAATTDFARFRLRRF